MGTLANSVFQLLLDWIRALSVEIWNTVSSPDGSTLFGLIGKNWIWITLVLCAAGLVIDLIVYMFRWRPYRVWASFFRRMRHRKDFEDSEEEPDFRPVSREWEEETGSESPEVPIEYAEDRPKESRTGEAEEDSEPLVWRRTEPEGTTAAFEQAILPARRRRVTRLFTEKGEEETAAPEDLIDRYAAYRRPVYPRNWKMDEADQEEK